MCNNTKSISSKKLYSIIIPIIQNECNNLSINDNDIKKVMSNLEKNINSECKRLESRKELLNKKIQKSLEHIKIAYNDKLELKINDEVFVDIKEQKEREIEQCRKQVYDIEKKIEIEKSKHTISYNQIKKLSEDFLNTDKITKQVLEKLVDRIEFDSNRNINLKLVFSNIKNENRYP